MINAGGRPISRSGSIARRAQAQDIVYEMRHFELRGADVQVMIDKKDEIERQESLTPGQQAPDEVLADLRRLYARYGGDPVPPHILDLAREVERALGRAARERAHSPLPDPAVPRQK
jgi:hypothetical protein